MLRASLRQDLLLLGCVALSAAACGKFREVSMCRGLSRDINGSLDEIEALSKRKPVDEVSIAKRYATLAGKLDARGVGQTPLALAVHDYSAILRATDVALRAHAEATKLPLGRASEPRRELERLVKREHLAVTRIEAECHN